MRKWGLALALAAVAPLGACVQTRQYADVQFTPPQGDYKLLVLRPDVTVGSLTTGGMVEPRADWTEQARANIVAALRAQQAARGGKVQIIERRDRAARGRRRRKLADVERLNCAVGQSIVLHKYLGAYLPTKRGKGLDWTLGEDAVAARPEDRLRLCLVPPRRGPGASRPAGSRSACSAWPAASSASARPTSAARRSSLMPRWSTSTPARSSGSTSSSAGSQVAGIKFGDLRTPEGAAQMVERLLGRMKPGPRSAGAGDETALMCMRCLEISRRSLLAGGGVDGRVAGHRRRRRRASGRRTWCRWSAPAIARPTRTSRGCGSRCSGSRRRSPAPTC